jgi:UDPglucose 6-dehydrogenase
MNETRRIYGEREDLVLVEEPLAALDGADALAIVTEWTQFRSPDFQELRTRLRHPVIFDGRNILDHGQATAAGIDYVSIGRTPIRPSLSRTDR